MSNGYVLDDAGIGRLHDVRDMLILFADLTGQGRQQLTIDSNAFSSTVSSLAAGIDEALQFLPVVNLDKLKPLATLGGAA